MPIYSNVVDCGTTGAKVMGWGLTEGAEVGLGDLRDGLRAI